MAEDKKSFVAYADWKTQFDLLSDEEAGKLIKHVFSYVNDENPEFTNEDRLLKMAFEPIKNQLKRDLKKYEATKTERSNSGTVGNLKRWHVDLYDLYLKKEITLKEAQKIANARNKSLCDNSDRYASQTVAKIAVNVNDNVTVNDNVDVTVNDNVTVNSLLGADAQKKTPQEEKKEISKKFGKPEFKKELMLFGVSEQHADDWIKVRTAKRASFTATVIQALVKECNDNNFSIADAVRICAEQSWQGFKISWVQNLNNNGKQQTTTAGQSRQQRVDEVSEFRKSNQQALAAKLQEYISSDNEQTSVDS